MLETQVDKQVYATLWQPIDSDRFSKWINDFLKIDGFSRCMGVTRVIPLLGNVDLLVMPGTERGLRNGWAARIPSPKTSVAEEVLIEASNGQEYHVSIPKSPKARWCSTPPRPGRFDRTKYQQPEKRPEFLPHEHRLLAGFACFIEDLEAEEYRRYWITYHRNHSRHKPWEWRKYYETEIQPAFRQRATREAAQSPDGRRDSKLDDLIDIGGELDLGETRETPENKSSEAAVLEDVKDVGANVSETLLSSQAAAVNSEDKEVKRTVGTKNPESEGSAITLPDDDKDLEVVVLRTLLNGQAAEVHSGDETVEDIAETAALENEHDAVALSEDDKDLQANAPEIFLNGQVAVVHSDDETVEEAVETKTSENECGAGALPDHNKHAEASIPEILLSGEAAAFHPKDAQTEEAAAKATPHARPVYSKSQKPFKAGLLHSKHAHPTETGLARPIHMRSVSASEIKHIPIPSFSSAADPALRRGVLITDISVGTALEEVLEGVDSSAIDRASLLNTAGMKTWPPMTSETALVEFYDGRVAREFCAERKEGGFVRLIETETRMGVEMEEVLGGEGGGVGG